MASITALGFWEDEAESRYTRRVSWTLRCRIGKSAWTRATSSPVVGWSCVTAASPPRSPPPPAHEGVDPVGVELVEDPLVVGDQHDPELGPVGPDLADAAGDGAEGVDVQA